ncbi:MAG: hypothetical protein AAF810_04475 [Cyanobacteria bacterium P01_D01_bin.36]
MSDNNYIELPSGAFAVRQPLKGKDYLRFQALAAKAVGKNASPTAMTEANEWLLLRAYKINIPIQDVVETADSDTPMPPRLLEDLTIDILENMSFQDVAILSSDMTEHFLLAAQPATE